MVTLFSEETIRELHDYNVAKDAKLAARPL